MALRELDKPEWQTFCDDLSKALRDDFSQTEIASLAVGEEVATEWVPLSGITYDRHSDAFEMILDGLEHWVRAPKLLYIDEGRHGVTALDIIDASNHRHSLRLDHPLKVRAKPP
jgi:Family of unknown function (DUF5335)